ncbi:hypothetical protein GQ55_9G465400 [Panicum hallii var. hallii]|uniref:Uncharacterized protein n=1 Tax=Panicum hallii var. hallii TaxID=1504633 RepID=A0A2T7CCA6_9POAL|nr:hypothetical protein GQ55_9G465400 [Panicum hallii var. hallii]
MPLAERAQSLKRGDSRAHAARSTSFAGLSLLRRRGAPRVIVVRRRRGAVDKTSAHDTSTAESAVTLAANHRCPLRLSPSPDPVTSTAKSARRSTPTPTPTPTAASAAWGCAGGRPSPPRLPSVPSPAAPPGSRRPAARLRSAVCAAGDSTRRPVWLGPRLPRAVKRWPAAAPLVASHRTAATATGARQATARSRAGANARPDPSADRPTGRVPDADGHQLQQVHGRRQGHPAAHTPNSASPSSKSWVRH